MCAYGRAFTRSSVFPFESANFTHCATSNTLSKCPQRNIPSIFFCLSPCLNGPCSRNALFFFFFFWSVCCSLGREQGPVESRNQSNESPLNSHGGALSRSLHPPARPSFQHPLTPKWFYPSVCSVPAPSSGSNEELHISSSLSDTLVCCSLSAAAHRF